MLKVVAPETFNSFVAELNSRGRRHVKLLKERDITLTREAHQLLNHVAENETLFLHSKLIRKGAQ